VRLQLGKREKKVESCSVASRYIFDSDKISDQVH